MVGSGRKQENSVSNYIAKNGNVKQLEPLRAAPFGKPSDFRAASHNMTQLAYKNHLAGQLSAWSRAGGNTNHHHHHHNNGDRD